MIDYVKISVTDSRIAAKLREHICTRVEVDHTTAELVNEVYMGKFRDLKILVYPSDRIVIDGSLHKYSEGGTNCGDFTIRQCRQAIFSLCSLFGIDQRKVKVDNFEFGVNVRLNGSPNNVLGSIVCLHDGKPFVEQGGGGLKCCKYEFRHKVYNKSSQYRFNGNNLLRYELHIDKMRKVLAVKMLHDLTKLEVWESLGKILELHFMHIVFEEEYNLEQFTKSERRYFYQYESKINNARFWKGLKPVERFRHKKRLAELQTKARFQWNTVIRQLIREKLDQLKQMQ